MCIFLTHKCMEDFTTNEEPQMQEMIPIRRWQTVKIRTEAKKRVAKAKAEGLCVACLAPAYGRMIRGCHQKCYRATIRAIEKGLTTETERLSQGKLLPIAQAGRKPSTAVMLDVLAGDE